MKLSLVDKSNYFRGLMILLKQDKEVSRDEKEIMMRVCASLGFNKKFCADSMSEILENPYVVDDPPVFSDNEFAESFLNDGFRLAVSNKEITDDEVIFLQNTAEKNGIERERFRALKDKYLARPVTDTSKLSVTEYV